MEVTFANSKLAKTCNSDKKLRGEYSSRMAELIQQRLADLAAVECLEDMRSLPGRCHELSQNLKGRLAVDLVHPDRLVFKPVEDPLPAKPDGGLDWAKVHHIEVVGIGDYHG
jgi:plasmid maintenance system killer protein